MPKFRIAAESNRTGGRVSGIGRNNEDDRRERERQLGKMKPSTRVKLGLA